MGGASSISTNRHEPVRMGEAHDGFQAIMNELKALREEVSSLKASEVQQQRALEKNEESQEDADTNSLAKKSDQERNDGDVVKSNRTHAGNCDVMLSLNCRSMLDTALRFQNFLEGYGIKVWICVEMLGGTDFREDIVCAVDTCKVFIPLINEEWCLSKECKFEFNYAFRKNLTSDPVQPIILPICFPNLDWNAHSHVRSLLASTNALVYQPAEEDELLHTLLVSLTHCGCDASKGLYSKPIQKWTNKELCEHLNKVLLQPIVEKNVDGVDFSRMTDDDFKSLVNMGTRLALESRNQHTSNSTAVNGRQTTDHAGMDFASQSFEGTAPIPPPPVPSAAVADRFSGWYKVEARTVNYWDGNVTYSNSFLVCLHENGISSSGCSWTAGTQHSNYDGVTCVWQGRYSPSGNYYLTTKYSNNTHEEWSGNLQIIDNSENGQVCALNAYGCCSKYAWWGYGNVSYGECDILMHKLSGDDTKLAKEILQEQSTSEKSDGFLENAMSVIGPALDWDEFDIKRDLFSSELQTSETSSFVKYPAEGTSLCAGKTFCIQFDRPDGAEGSDDLVAICEAGSDSINHDSSFAAWDCRIQRGVVFPSENVPSAPGEYDVVYFSKSAGAIARHRIRLVSPRDWLSG